jgi:hypothetical protein
MTSNYPKMRLTVIKCECGLVIPVIPDVEKLGKAIDAHIEEHKTKENDSSKGEIAAKRIHDNLFGQLFKKINDIY